MVRIWRVVVLMTALLTIGTATTRISLLDSSGFLLSDWIPHGLDHSGTWRVSPFGDGRRQIDYRNENVIDTFELKLRHTSQDGAIRATQGLRQMLRTAIDYWKPQDIWTVTETTSGVHAMVPSAPEPVYLAARGPQETNARYALVYDARLPTDDNPYAQPFASVVCRTVAMDDLALVVEHGPWTANPPGESDCAETSGERVYGALNELSWAGSPAASADDGYVEGEGVDAHLTATMQPVGKNPVTSEYAISGIRFPNVTVPQGATILRAWIEFEAAFSDSDDPTKAIIYGNDVDNAAQFSDGLDMHTRDLVRPAVYWPTIHDAQSEPSIEPWTAGNTYETPDIGQIIQVIVDREGWASGNAMAIMIHDFNTATPGGRRAATFDHLTAAAAILNIFYTVTDYTYGRTGTCEDEVFVGNKDNKANITDIYNYIAAAWSGNLVGNYPYNMFPAAGTNGDAIYFGCDSTLTNSGPFCSLVFDVSATLTYGGAATIDWEYYNGAAWVALNEQDNTTVASGAGPFAGRTGVHSVHWLPDNSWATANLNTLFGGAAPNVTAFWVRAVATIGGGDSITGPATQQNRDVYTITWSQIDIDDEQVAGDIPALARIRIEGVGAAPEGYHPYSERAADRLFVGLRTTVRGDEFRQFLNFSDEQNMTGVYVRLGDDAAWVTDTSTPTGRLIRYTPSATSEHIFAIIELGTRIAPQYYGSYRAFLRLWHDAGATSEFAVRLRWQTGYSGFEQESDLVTISDTGRGFTTDMGRVTIPPAPMLTGAESLDTIVFSVSATTAALPTAGTLDIYDLVLIPTDEWFGEFEAPPDPRSVTVRNMGWNRILDIDSLGNPKRAIRAPLVVVSDGYIASQWICRSTGPCILHPRTAQQLYFFTTKLTTSEPEYASRVQLFVNDRYMSMRGNL